MIRLKRARVQVGPPAGANPCAPCHVCSLISGAHYSPYLVRQLSEFVSVAVAVAVAVAILSWRAFPFQLAGKSSPNLITLHMKYFWGFSTGCHGERERSWVRQGRENPADLHLADREGGKAGRRRGWLLGRHSLGINGSCLWQSSSICSRSFGDLSAAAALPVDCQFARAPPACCLLPVACSCCLLLPLLFGPPFAVVQSTQPDVACPSVHWAASCCTLHNTQQKVSDKQKEESV